MGRRVDLELKVKIGSDRTGPPDGSGFRQLLVSLLIIIILVLVVIILIIVVLVVIIIVILSGLDALGHEVVPITGDSGALGGVVQSAEHRLVELAGRLQVQSGLGLVVGPLRIGEKMEYSCNTESNV